MVLGVLAAVSAPAPVSAHAFLATTEPAQGERLPSPPTELTLGLSEPVVAVSTRVTLERFGSREVDLGRPSFADGGRVVRVPTPSLDAGVYAMAWHVVSAVDGHESAGEMAFAVGEGSGQIPAATTDVEGTDWLSVVSGWLFFGGSAVAGGGLLAAWIGVPGAGSPGRRRLVQLALMTAVGAALLRLPGLPAGTSGVAWLLFAATLLALAAVLAGARPGSFAPLLAAAGGWTAWSTRSHAAAEGTFGLALDALHLTAGVLWTGALVHLGITLWQRRRTGWEEVRDAVRRYGRVAAGLVLVLALAGVASALRLLPEVADLWSTGYGVLILAKLLLLALAVTVAVAARRRGLHRPGPRLTRRLVTTEALLLAAALGLAGVLAQIAPPRPAGAAETALGPTPIEGAVTRAAGLAGSLTVDVQAGDGRVDLAILSPSGGVDGAAVDIDARLPDSREVDLRPRPCGPGCFTMGLGLPEGTTHLDVTARAPGWEGGTTTLDLHWPPGASTPQRFDTMVAALQEAPTLRFTERVSSGPGPKEPGSPETGGVTMSGEEFLALMPYAGGGVTDVRSEPGDPSAFSFYLPGSRMYFEVRVDPEGRPIEQRLVNPGHEIRYRLAYPDGRPAAPSSDSVS